MKNVKTVILTTVALTLICAVAAGLLALTNHFTADKIAQVEKDAQSSAMKRIVAAEKFEEAEIDGTSYNIATDSEGKILGYIFTTSANGYGGEVKVMTGIDQNGNIIAIEVVSAGDETPGLGQNATKSSFWDLFKGKSGKLAVAKNASADNEIQAMTGATITSNAVVTAVNEATALFEKVKEAE